VVIVAGFWRWEPVYWRDDHARGSDVGAAGWPFAVHDHHDLALRAQPAVGGEVGQA
jgi:hypothetical protein